MRKRFIKAKNKQKNKVVLCILTALIGLGLIIYSGLRITDHSKKMKTYIDVTGHVVEYEYNDNDEACIIVEYIVKRETYTIKSDTCSNMPKSIGSEVALKFNEKNPSDAIFVVDSANFIVPIIGVLFFALGIYATIDAQKNLKKEYLDVEKEHEENKLT